MRSVLQRVNRAEVEIQPEDGASTPPGTDKRSIGKGILALVAFQETDDVEDLRWMAKKIAQIRIFPDTEGKMNLSLKDVDGEVLVVSQFTLYADSSKGNRPSFTGTARPETAQPLYDQFLKFLETEHDLSPKSGEFGAHMKVSLENDGPVTVLLDSP